MKSIWKAAASAVLLFGMLQLAGCGDTYRSILTPIPQQGGNPSTFDMVGVIQQSGPATDGVVTQINVSGDTNMGEQPIGAGAAMGLLQIPNSLNSFAFTPNSVTANVTAVVGSRNTNPVSFTKNTISLPDNSVPEFIGGTKGGVVYVANSAATTNCPSGSVGVINTASLVFTQEICIPAGSPHFLVQTADTTKIFVLSPAAGKVTIIDSASAAVENTLSVGGQPTMALVSLDQQFVYVMSDSTISLIRISDQTVMPTTLPVGPGANFMALDKKLNRLYVVDGAGNSIHAFDLTNSSVPAAIGGAITVAQGSANPVQLTALTDGSRVYVLNSDATVTELLASNLSIIKTITVNNAAGAVGKSITSPRDASRVYVASSDPTNTTNAVTILRTVDDSVATTIKSPQLDSACDPTKTSCARMTPVYLFTTSN
jgi:hypothetical protein